MQNPLVESKRSELEGLCRKYGVSRLELFGSATTPEFDPKTSDLDFLVEFASMREGAFLCTFFGLKADLETLFGRRVDLVEPVAIRNQYFRRGVEATRELLYAA